MVTMIELIPISTFLTLVVNEVIEVAVAAKDVLVEKESFQKLSRYLYDIEPVLKELEERCFKDLTAANTALQSLKNDLDRARTVVKDCQDKSKFYLLLRCKTIVKDVQQVTRDIGKDLELLALAGTELSLDVRDNLHKLRNQFLCAEYQASEARLEILERLETGIREHRTDQGFANDLLVAIANAVGVPVLPSEINKELSSFKREKEHLAERKARQEEAFMEQVIQLLSRADAASTFEVSRGRYSAAPTYTGDEPMDPLPSFICPLNQGVMEDPVLASSNRTYERKEISRWFSAGNTTDPVTHVELEDFSLRPNNALRKSILEWRDMNLRCRIRKCKRILQAGEEQKALDDLFDVLKEIGGSKEDLAEEGIITHVVAALGVHNNETRAKALEVLQMLVHKSPKNRDEVVEVGGLELIVRCLGKNQLSKLAVSLVLELLDDNTGAAAEKLCQEKSAMLYLIMLQNGDDTAKRILQQLSDKDENIVKMASMSYFEPLVVRIIEGSNDSKLLMARALGSIESLSEENKQMLGEKGVIAPLVTMLSSGKIETTLAALEALENLSANTSNQAEIVRTGGFAVIMNHLIAPRTPQRSRECAAAILKNLTMHQKDVLAQEDVKGAVDALLGILSSPYVVTTRASVLQILFGMANTADGAQVQSMIKSYGGITFLIQLLEDTDRELRESAVHLLCCLSKQESRTVADCFIKDEKLGLLINLLKSSSTPEVGAALAELLASFPDDKGTRKSMVEAGAVPALLSAIRKGVPMVTEKALSAMQRFTEPSDLQLQAELARSDVHSILVGVLESGTLQSKALAASALKNFSMSTHQLSTAPAATAGWLCFFRRSPPVCKIHQGVCSATSTFCIIEAKAVPSLVSLLEEPGSQAAEAAVGALYTLVSNKETVDKGALYLHDMNAIQRIIVVIARGTETAKAEAIAFLERIFDLQKMRALYGSRAKMSLVEAVSNGPNKRRAARVLAQLGSLQEVSSSYF